MDTTETTDMNPGDEMMLDGNALAGLFHDIFGTEMTASPSQCASCGHEGEIGSFLAFTQAPGTVVRCPACKGVIMVIVQTPTAIYLDARGAVYLRLPRTG